MPDRLKAIKPFAYDGKKLLPGDRFVTKSDKDTTLLVLIGSAAIEEVNVVVEVVDVRPIQEPEFRRPQKSKGSYRRRGY